MLYMANPTGGEQVRVAMRAGLLGYIDTPAQRNRRPAGVLWCADNGCFGRGYPGDGPWIGWLGRNTHDAERCLFAVAPDVFPDAGATLVRSSPWLPRIRELGFPAALVAQNGLERLAVPWDDFDVLFVGGTTDWKLGPHARRLVEQAKERGKRAHMGRVNSQKRLHYARHIGCDTCDGTMLTFGPDKYLPDVLKWATQGDLFRLETP